ncbi:uncharacterized protein LOC124827532 [Vigna umbellata]|uniref:uncharacterized protein LOC124827532 n=1 Tax=Vigna umbellata TaxID=87088 RepID=UPI001F5F7ADB|nr:uncharacterized protein LOC124827532 [Vigna umbellata]XP_047156566.1 uncharacterized protein LOC124827532 [Vigna umbellata]
MGTDDSDSMVLGSSPVQESGSVVRGSEQAKEAREDVGGLRSEEGCGGVAVNGDGFSSIENQGLGDEGVVNVVNNSNVLEAKVSVVSGNDCQVLADSEVNGVTSWLGMQESDMSTVFSSDGTEKLDYDYASEKMDYMFASEMEETAVLSLDGSVGDGGEHGSDGGRSGEEGKYEDCDVDNVTLGSESGVVEVAVLSGDSVVGAGAERTIDRKEVEDCDVNIGGIDTESRGGVAAVMSVHSLLGVDGCDRREEDMSEEKDKDDDGNIVVGFDGQGRREEEGKDEDCDGNDVITTSESGPAEAAVLIVGKEDAREEDMGEGESGDGDCDGNVVTVTSDSRLAEAAVSGVDIFVGLGREDKREKDISEEEGGDQDRDGNVVTITSGSRVSEDAVLSVDSFAGIGGQDRREENTREEEEGKDKDCDGDIVAVASESKVAEASALRVDNLANVGGKDTLGEDCDGNVVTLASQNEVGKAADFSGDSVVGLGAYDKTVEECEGKGKKAECGGNIVTITSENRAEDAAVLSVDGSKVVGVEEAKDGGDSEEVEKDKDCSENIVTIEVPIAETSENMDVDVEDLSDEGYGFAVGDFVWGQADSKLWWPGRIYDPSDASDDALKLKQKNRLLVTYFGHGTFAWCHPSQLKRFEDNFDDMVKQSSCLDFANAVQEAASEVGRLLSMKLSRLVVDQKTGSESESIVLLEKNSGIKEGVVVPETGIDRLLYSQFEPAELLSHVNRIARIIDSGSSIMELEILKARLSAYYLSKGHKLPDFMDTQLVPGVGDSLMDETVAVENSKSTVEAPTQGPFDELGHSPGLSGSISNHVRKQKSIAEIMREDKDVHTASREVEAIGSNGGKKRKGGEDGMASKPVQKKKELLLVDTDEDVSSAEHYAKENSGSIGSWLRSKERKEVLDEGKSEERSRKGSLSRERKKSKYLSPPFTTPIRGQREESMEAESFTVSRKVKASQTSAVAAVLQYPPVYMGRFFDSSNYQTEEDDGKMVIDPKKIQAPVEEVLFQVRNAAISPQIRREGTSLDQFVDFTFVFRSSLYSEGSLLDVYEKNEPGRKRKKPESEEDGTLKEAHIPSVKQKSGTKKKRKETASGKKGADENAEGAVLVVSFCPGTSMPSRSDLISVYSKFGALNEAETDMLYNDYTARVSFLRSFEAENAFNHSKSNNPFGSSDVTFQLEYGQDGERSKNTPLLAATPPSVSLSQGGEASRLIFIQKKLQGLTLILEASGDKSPDLMAKLHSEVKALLEDVNQMVEASLF